MFCFSGAYLTAGAFGRKWTDVIDVSFACQDLDRQGHDDDEEEEVKVKYLMRGIMVVYKRASRVLASGDAAVRAELSCDLNVIHLNGNFHTLSTPVGRVVLGPEVRMG